MNQLEFIENYSKAMFGKLIIVNKKFYNPMSLVFVSSSSLFNFSNALSVQRTEEQSGFLLFFSIIFILLILSIIFLVLFIRKNRKKTQELRILFSNNELQNKIIDTISHTLPVAILITDTVGNIIKINREFYKLFELDSRNEFVNKNVLDLSFDDSFTKDFFETTHSAQNKGKVVSYFSFISKSKRTKHIQHICSFEKIDYSQSTFLLNIFIDVTEQKQIELNKDKYKTYNELTSDAIWCFKGKQPIPVDLPVEEQIRKIFETAYLSECNYAFCKFYGFNSIEEAIGTPLSTIISPTNPSKIELLKNFILNNYNLSGFVTNFVAPNETEYFVRNSLFGIIEDGKLVRAWGIFQDITDLMKLQKQYQDTASQYENLIENLNSIILHMDLEGNILFINSFGAKFFGYEREELLGKPVVGTIVPTIESLSGRDLTNLIKEILQNPKKFEYNENENIKKDGTRVWISWKNTPVFNPSGECVEILSVGIDLTEQKRKELEIIKTWEFIYSMVEAIPDAVSFKDGKGRWVFANKSMLEVFNLIGKDVIGKTDLELIEYDEFFREELEACAKSDELAWEKKAPIQRTEIVKKLDGGYRIFDLIKVPAFNEDGSRRGIAIIARDVTLQKEMEKALQESEKKYKDLVNALPLPAIVLQDGKIVFANKSSRKIFNFLTELGGDFSIFQSFFKSEDYEKLVKAEKLDLGTEIITFNVESINGDKIFSVTLVSFFFGLKRSLLMVFNEITEQILYSSYLEKVQRELIYQKYELERVNNELSEKNKELAELNATKDRFFSIIAHDLKNPIYGIKNLSDEFLLSFDELKIDEMREFVFAINSSSTKLMNLIENLLLWAKTQTRTLSYNPVELNLKYFVDNTISLFQDSVKGKNIVLLSRINENIIVYVDANCLGTILRNLISNAIKFTYEGGVIRIYSQELEEDGKLFEKVSVQDNGVGIPYEVQEKLLQLDFHYTSLGTKNERGTGLGLNIVKELVAINGGRIWFESTPKVGTTFHFTLPKKGLADIHNHNT